MKYYIVDEKRLQYLEEQTMLMEALECGGVDNWGGFGTAIEIMEEANDVDDISDLIDLDTQYTETILSE